MMILRCLPLIALICGPGLWAEALQDPGQESKWVRPRVFEFHVAPGPELYYEIRTLATQEDAEVPEQFAAAVAEVREIGSFLASPLSWPVVDGAFTAIDTPGKFALGLAERVLPPKGHMAEGVKRIRVANSAARLAAHLDALAPTWMEEQWPDRKAALESRADALSERFSTDRQRLMMKALDNRIGIKTGAWVVPVKLVRQMAGVQSGSFLESNGVMTCVLSTHNQSLSVLGELALYEVMHSLNAQPFHPASMPKTMLEKLREAKIDPALSEAARNKLMHLCAADLMRQFIDVEHVDAGLATGDYARRPKLHALEEHLWAQFCAGEILRPELVDTLCLVLGTDWDENKP
jgi:hypothetical protein